MRERATSLEKERAQAAYDFIIRQPLGAIVPSEMVQNALGLTRVAVTMAVHWAIRDLCPETGVLIASRRGVNGGYHVTLNRDDAEDTMVRLLKGMWTAEQRMSASVQAAKKGRQGTRHTLRKQADEIQARINSIENALADLDVMVGHVKEEHEAEAKKVIQGQVVRRSKKVTALV